MLIEPVRWPAWGAGSRHVDVLDPGGIAGVCARYRLTFRTALAYTLAFGTEITRAMRPGRLESTAAGELTARGTS